MTQYVETDNIILFLSIFSGRSFLCVGRLNINYESPYIYKTAYNDFLGSDQVSMNYIYGRWLSYSETIGNK